MDQQHNQNDGGQVVTMEQPRQGPQPANHYPSDPVGSQANGAVGSPSEGYAVVLEDGSTVTLKVCKRRLQAADVFRVVKILGAVGKEVREQLLALGEKMTGADMIAVVFTGGAEKAQGEIDAWVSALTGIPAEQIPFADPNLYMDVLEDLDKTGLRRFLARAIRWYRETFSYQVEQKSSSGSGSTAS